MSMPFKKKPRDVIADISPLDVMYNSNPDHYFFWGSQALETIERFVALIRLSTVRTILDLPCGHGRVLRFLRSSFPDAVIAACDIDRDAVDFCARTFDAQPIYSTIDLKAVPLEGSYDLIWCGSLLTHIHADQWRQLLELFSRHLSDSGLLVFTTCGRRNAQLLSTRSNTFGLSEWAVSAILSDYDQFGFGYQNYSGREGIGLSLSSPSWVCSEVVQIGGLQLAGYHEGGWGGVQDAVACVKYRDAPLST